MGLLGKLFEKKICDVCGEEIKLLGNRKLENGNLCKNCASKLSPWFSERRASTVEEIKEQLKYRQENAEKVDQFHITRTLGLGTKVLLDEDARKFMVTGSRNIKDANPDVLDYADVTGCDIDVNEHRSEVMKDGEDGTQVSYNPKRYDYSYDINLIIHVNNPYFNEMRFRVNNSTIWIESTIGRVTAPDPLTNADYREAMEHAEEIKAALTSARTQIREEAAAAHAPKIAVTCPWCNATTIPDGSGRCEYCGGSIS